MKFYPQSYFKSILEVSPEFLRENNIKAVLVDIDNTIINYNKDAIPGIEKWAQNIKDKDIKLCILSNTYKKEKAERISKLLEIPYVHFAKKPFKRGFNKAKKILNIEENEQIAVIGDQVLTDVLGANRSKMYSILVKPIEEKDILVTRFNRIVEKIILKGYFKENKKQD